jgi:hypothetical protein
VIVRWALGRAFAGALLAGGLCAKAGAACLTADGGDQAAEGRLAYMLFVDFAGHKEHAYILALKAPVCLDGKNDNDQVESTKRIHVYSMDAKLRGKMRGLVGRSVRVQGSPFGEHTVYHHAPIVMNIVTIERR